MDLHCHLLLKYVNTKVNLWSTQVDINKGAT